MRIYFQFLESQHVPLIYAWFQTPHIKKWYGSEQEWAIEAIGKKYNPHRLQANKIAAFIIYDKQIPIGYIQKYSVSDYPWEELDLSKLASKLAGIDLFIGNPAYLYQGFGQLILEPV
ncbi:GNAT family N-acetyltransferase [Candidatus Protochlamydia amoebophila]|uniref:Putative aminoglycoside N6'-acetyltransferase n=1 Tax=Candidatus Protochlamydia amoebophila TaxID=362787 RepID=A0A0C1H8L7_9BACT|nr:GNAT family N-acetyltransferase [Candidatus Protochlamydia amoebophila]KIC71223.1 putative aminoglycoside N6'-acetyltransferase [Candidatus Protochlamydia amoebophila]